MKSRMALILYSVTFNVTCKYHLPFSSHFTFVATAIFPYLISSDDIALGKVTLSVSSRRGWFYPFHLRCTLFVIKTRGSRTPACIGKSTRRSRANTSSTSSGHFCTRFSRSKPHSEVFLSCSFLITRNAVRPWPRKPNCYCPHSQLLGSHVISSC